MALCILNVKLFTFNFQKGTNAMSRHNVISRTRESKLPVVPIGEGLFDLEALMNGLEQDTRSFISRAGLEVIKGLIDREVSLRAGERHSQGTDVNRWGRQRGSVLVGGQRHPIRLPRLRTREGKEVGLSSYRAFRRNGSRSEAVYNRLIAGVSCRDYAGTVEEMADGYGISRSVASREMITATAKNLKALVERDLRTLEICILIIDGVRLGERVMIVAEGVDSGGNKQMLGFREGSTENARVCADLVQELLDRGLSSERPMLIVLDGSKALRTAVDRCFGTNAIVQRCQQHKRENVKKYLPQRYHPEIDRKIKAIYAMKTHQEAASALGHLVAELERINVSAANSLREGMEETLTMHRLGVPEILRKSFSTTNLIESAFSYGRRVIRNVKRWKTSEQAHRWTATALVLTEKRFRRIRGYGLLPVLMNALKEEASRRGKEQRVSVA